ncbi:MAG: hypothetical protein OXI15_14580 [Chromatiales bacterium]|nr:hypothetical protein [Chromatiales bacterium]
MTDAADLAYCLYDICTNKRRDTAEAMSCNPPVAVWVELALQSAAIRDADGAMQRFLDW